MNKLIITLLIIGLLVLGGLSLTACTNNQNNSSTDDSISASSTDVLAGAVDDQLVDDSDSVEIGSMI